MLLQWLELAMNAVMILIWNRFLIVIRRACPEVRSSGSPSPARWLQAAESFCWMSRPAALIMHI
jgi:hypothetical protein